MRHCRTKLQHVRSPSDGREVSTHRRRWPQMAPFQLLAAHAPRSINVVRHDHHHRRVTAVRADQTYIIVEREFRYAPILRLTLRWTAKDESILFHTPCDKNFLPIFYEQMPDSVGNCTTQKLTFFFFMARLGHTQRPITH